MTPFALILDSGGVRTAPTDDAARANGSAALVWIHLDANDPATAPWLADKAGLNDLVVNALTATETRPRCEPIDTGALINMRGLAAQPETLSDALASIRLWTERGRVISVIRHDLLALPPVVAAMKAGKVLDPGDLVTALAMAITEQLDPDVADLGDLLDDCELRLDADKVFVLRRMIARGRAKAIDYRRFVVPQRQALEKLSHLDCDWLDERDRNHLAEAADRFARMGEELESVRERAALMHEQLTDLRAEVIETRALLISVVALVFLPLTFLTGLLGMNVEGIPYAKAPWAFWGVVGVCVAIAFAITAYFMKAHWFRR